MLLLRKRCAIPTSTYRQQEFTVSNQFISTCHNTGTRGVTPKLTPSAVPAFGKEHGFGKTCYNPPNNILIFRPVSPVTH